MRKKDIYMITCAKCQKENRYEDYSYVGPEEREIIMNDSIMSYTCPYCHEVSFLKHPLTYIDPIHHFIVQYGQNEAQFAHFCEQLHSTPLYHDYLFRYTDSWLAFKEKIMILEKRDDRLIELYKKALKQELKEEDQTLFLYNREEEKELMIALSPSQTRAYLFNQDWYDLKENDPFISKVLKYDTSLVVDSSWVACLYDDHLKTYLCEVDTHSQVKMYLIPSYVSIEVDDEVQVMENGRTVSGKVMTKNYKALMDVPDHLHFIERKIFKETEYDCALKEEYLNLITSGNKDSTFSLESCLDLLNDLRFYYYVEEKEESLSHPLVCVEGDWLLPLYIDHQEAKNHEEKNCYLLSDLLIDVLKMTFEKIDGYLVTYHGSRFVMDSQLIDMFISYAQKKKSEIN